MNQLPALIWGYVCALGVQTPGLSFAAPRPAREPVSAGLDPPDGSLRGLKIVAQYRRFPMYMVGYGLASSARDRLVQIMLGIGAGAAVVGRFGLAYRVVFAPNSLIYSAVSPIFFAIASRGSRAAGRAARRRLGGSDVRGDGRALRVVRDRGSGADGGRLAGRQDGTEPARIFRRLPARRCFLPRRAGWTGPSIRSRPAEGGVHARSIVHRNLCVSHRLSRRASSRR